MKYGLILAALLISCVALSGGVAVGPDDGAGMPKPGDSRATRPGVTVEKLPGECIRHKFNIYSPSMKRNVRAIVVLPPGYDPSAARTYPVLHTLHGMGAPYGTFSDMSPLWKALKTQPTLLTCFDADRASWYLDAKNPVKVGGKEVKSLFTTFFFKEFIPLIDKTFRVDKTKRCLTGFSMGGYGSLHYMLTKPEMFRSVSALSVGNWSMNPPAGRSGKRLAGMLGPYEQNKPAYAAADLQTRIDAYARAKTQLPPVYLHCGTEDRLLAGHNALAKHMKSVGMAVEVRQSPGAHNWKFWKGASADMLDFHWRSFEKDYKPRDHTAAATTQPTTRPAKAD